MSLWAAVPPVLTAVSSFFGGRSRRRAERNAEKEWKRAYQAALEANERRFKWVTNLLTDLRTRSLGALDAQSRQNEADLSTEFRNLTSAGAQDLVSRGLSGTTLMPNLRSGMAGKYSSALARLRDLALARRVGIDQATTGDLARVIENRTDTYPERPQLSSQGTDWASIGGNLWSAVRQLFERQGS
ncbi:hypothetical protein HS125_04470 [bacterium]|nr:hypothetical protein [bacterium]